LGAATTVEGAAGDGEKREGQAEGGQGKKADAEKKEAGGAESKKNDPNDERTAAQDLANRNDPATAAEDEKKSLKKENSPPFVFDDSGALNADSAATLEVADVVAGGLLTAPAEFEGEPPAGREEGAAGGAATSLASLLGGFAKGGEKRVSLIDAISASADAEKKRFSIDRQNSEAGRDSLTRVSGDALDRFRQRPGDGGAGGGGAGGAEADEGGTSLLGKVQGMERRKAGKRIVFGQEEYAEFMPHPAEKITLLEDDPGEGGV
jgi:hypothetical protein